MNKIRVGAYCRFSTDKDDQLNSLENQKKYFEEYIQRHENWEFVNIYPDERYNTAHQQKNDNNLIK